MKSNQRPRNKLTYSHLGFDKEVKTIQWEMENIFNKWCWSNWMPVYNANRSIFITLHKTQAQVDQRLLYKIGNSK